MIWLRAALLTTVVGGLLASGCGSLSDLWTPSQDPPRSLAQKNSERRWVLIRNPFFKDHPSATEYTWVEEEKIPTTFRTVIYGKESILAPPDVVARYGSPPGGGKISQLQGGPYAGQGVAISAEPASRPRAAPAPVTDSPPSIRGYVVYVEPNRIVIDLIARDGLKPGSLVSVRRDKISIVHPVTGKPLGELDEEVAIAKVVELRDLFSVAEIQSLSPGHQIKVKDRVVPR
jgi:hypothetical protein